MSKSNRHPITGCRADSLLGLWLFEPKKFESMYEIAVSVDLAKLADDHKAKMAVVEKEEKEEKNKSKTPYMMAGNIAVMEMNGPSTKYETSFADMFGGTSTIRMQANLRHAARNSDVKGIMLHISSHGGTVDGSFDLAEEIRRINKIKPVVAHGSDALESAAYLFGSQCRYLTANSNAQVGSIGVRAGLYDTSKKLEKEGVKALSFTAGKLKGGIPGAEISKEEIDDIQRNVDEVGDLFIANVSEGRGLEADAIRRLEARTYIASKAKELGLIDKVCSFDEALATFQSGKIPAIRGPGNSRLNPAASRSIAMALTAKQLKKARELPGAVDISEEDAAEVLLETAVDLNKELKASEEANDTLSKKVKELESKISPSMDETMLKGLHGIADKEIDLLLKGDKILAAQATALKEALLIDKKPNPVMFTKMANGHMPYESMLKTLDLNKPMGLTKTLSGDQPKPRDEPGKQDEDKEKTDDEQALEQADQFATRRYANMPKVAGGNGRK